MISGRRDGGQGVEWPTMLPEQGAADKCHRRHGVERPGTEHQCDPTGQPRLDRHRQATASLGPWLLGTVGIEPKYHIFLRCVWCTHVRVQPPVCEHVKGSDVFLYQSPVSRITLHLSF